jgi:outer membrane protein OmpA-like peptidoglycan-associated protein
VVKIPGYYPTDLDCLGQLKPISVLRSRGVGVIILGHRIRFILPTDTFFDRDYVDINECHVSTLAVIAEVIKSLPCAPICITGHVDNVGTCCEKLDKSKKLAETVAAHLWAQGIGWDRLHVIGRGDWDQIASDRTVFGSTDNRRVEIRIDFSGNYQFNCQYNNSYCPDCL